jgi:hypothetical protein
MLDDGECKSRESTVATNADAVLREESHPVLQPDDVREAGAKTVLDITRDVANGY